MDQTGPTDIVTDEIQWIEPARTLEKINCISSQAAHHNTRLGMRQPPKATWDVGSPVLEQHLVEHIVECSA